MTLDNNISVDIDRRGDDDAAGAAEEPAPTEAAGAADASDAVNAADAIDTDDAVDAADAPEAIDTGDAVDAADAIDTPGPIDADETSTINAAGDEVAVALDPSAELIDVVDLDDAQAAAPVEPSPYDRPGRWYVVHSYAGYENKVKSNLMNRVRSYHSEDQIFEIVIPMEDVIEFKGGQRRVVQKKMYPGYVLVRMDLDDNTWGIVRNTPGVTGFVGPSGAKPTPLSRKEVEDILGVAKTEGPAAEKKVRPRVEFEEGEQVRVVTGPFADFNGAIAEIDVDRSKLKVLVNIFGRETPVELEFGQVAKL